MGPAGVNYTIGNVKDAFGSVSKSLSVSLSVSLNLILFSLQFAHGGAVNWAASIGVR